MGSSHGKPALRQEDIAALAKSSGLDEIQVKQSFDAFVAKHPGEKMRHGQIRSEDLRDMMAKAMPKKDASKMEKHVFRMYDTNTDGYVDFNEFMLTFFIMSDGTPEDVLKLIFRMFDVNSDGTITQKEMTKLIKDMYDLLKEEDPNLPARDLVAKSVFAEMDADKDGKVTVDEFVIACLDKGESSRMLALKVINIFVGGDA